ncbi:hypothetical protein OQA88_10431 [Cercophora sp. LCS_1]
MVTTDWTRPPYSRSNWQAERQASDHMQDDGRYYGTLRSPPVPIDRVLREQCQINVQRYFLAVCTDEGQWQYFSGPERLPQGAVPTFFNVENFDQFRKRGVPSGLGHEDAVLPYHDTYYREAPEYPVRRRFDRHRHPGFDRSDEEMPPTNRTRKRLRGHVRRQDDDDPLPTVRSKKAIKVGNDNDVWDFYDHRFRIIQQNACKLIAKAWVKAVAPKKQTHNPYTAGDEKAPDWWPKPWGPTKEERVRHVEPDHLLKKERVHLLIHILRLVVEPNASQHPDIQKLGINVQKLEDVTMESLSSFFNDNNPTGKSNNAKKKPYLKEIFKVAKHEEQFRRGEIDATAEVFVMADDKSPEGYQSDDEMNAAPREEEGDAASVRSSRVSPPKAGSHSIMSTASTSHSPATNLQGPSFIGEIPVRGPPQFSQSIMPEMSSNQHSYVESTNITVGGPPPLQSHGSIHMQDMLPSPHESNRRPSLFNSPGTEFASTPNPGLYPGAWQQSTTAPANTTMYAFSTQQQQTQTPNSFLPQSSVPLSSPSYLGSSQFGSLPHPTNLYQSNGVGQNTASHSQGYQNYHGHDGRSMPSGGLKMEPLNRGPLH